MRSATDFLAYVQGRGQSFNTYSAGNKKYGAAGGSAPNVGPSDKSGYRKRDAKAKFRKRAMLRKIEAGQKGRFMSADYMTPQRGPNG